MSMEATGEDASRLGAVLVTGGCGYFGSNLVKILLRDPECSSVSVVCRNPDQNQEEGASYYEGDITNESNVKTLLFKIQPRVIFHLASPRPEAGKADQNRTNVLGTQILLACAAKIPSVRVLVYTSCAAAVELSPTNSRLTEEQSRLYTAKSRASPYEKSKAIADALVLAANSPGLRTVTLRLPPIYGEGDPVLTPNIMTMMRQGKHTIQIGKNQKVFDYVYIDNAIHGHILAARALLQPSEEKVDGEAFFITDDSPLPFYSFARKIWYAAGDRTEDEDIRVVSRGLVLATALINEWFYFVFSLGFKKPEVTFYDVRELEKGMCFSIEKARRRLGYNPVVLLDDGIKLAVDRGLERQDLRVIALRGRPEPDW